ncbi:dockerin type I domain-containing protein [Paenibacillus qinlingensis]|nr:dockerin type I domain-containing protein [Paenibacillus qinlingensis]
MVTRLAAPNIVKTSTRLLISIFFGFLLFFISSSVYAQPVIPGASGYGLDTPAGRGGMVYKVTSLEDKNVPGTLRYAISQSGPRVVVFEVSGTIVVNNFLDIIDPYLTIAGQTAPSPGIFLKGANIRIYTHDVLIQHIRAAPGDEPYAVTPTNRDALSIGIPTGRPDNIVVDHSTFTWSVDEIFGTWGPYGNVTFRNVIGAEPLNNSIHIDEGATVAAPHGFGPIFDNQPDSRVALIGSLLSHAEGRIPYVMASEYVEVNNVFYDRINSFNRFDAQKNIETRNSLVGNVFKNGPSLASWAVGKKPIEINAGFASGGKIYLSDNRVQNHSFTVGTQWDLIQNSSTLTQAQLQATEAPTWVDGLVAKPVGEVMDWVLNQAGARPADRLPYETRIINQARNGTGMIVNTIAEAGGWPVVAANQRKLVLPKNPSADADGDGYTNLEEWLESYAAFVEGRGSQPPLIDPAEGEPEDEQGQEEYPQIISELVVNPTATGASTWSIMTNLQTGNLTYSDRAFKFNYVPQTVAGSNWIMTAANSKAYLGNDPLATYKVLVDADVYVAYDRRLTAKPQWFLDAGYVATGEAFIINETLPFDLYKKTYLAGSTVTLGKNGNSTNLQYIPVVKSRPVVGNAQAAITNPLAGSTLAEKPTVIAGTASDSDTKNQAITGIYISILQNASNKYLNPSSMAFDQSQSVSFNVYASYHPDLGTWMLDVANVPFSNGQYTVTASVYDGAAGVAAESYFNVAVVDPTGLVATISNAQTVHDAAVVGTKPGQYPQGAKEILYAAIQAAQVTASNGSATQAQVDTAKVALQTAVDAFKAKIIPRQREDVNADGKINIADLLIVISHLHKSSNSPNWESMKASDVNGDLTIDAKDISLVAIKMFRD